MKAKNLLLILALGAMAMSCNNSSMTSTSASLKTAADSASYYIGYMYGSGLQNMRFKNPNMSAIVAGINTALEKKETKETPQEMEMYLNSYFQKQAMHEAQVNAEAGKKFLEENAKKSGIDTLANGIQYKVIKQGDGPIPTDTDVVEVNYKGTHLDGSEFDSSYKRGEPVKFGLHNVIPGWTTALKSMPVGSKWEVYIPADQAYGQRGGGPIAPNETLIFEIELLSIVAPEAPATDKK